MKIAREIYKFKKRLVTQWENFDDDAELELRVHDS